MSITRRFVVILSFAVSALTGCASTVDPAVDEARLDESTVDDRTAEKTASAYAIDPCATVRCKEGTHCEARGRRAVCVRDVGRCATDADCRLFDDYCDGCSCEALLKESPDPVCKGTVVACLVAPCARQTAVCTRGICIASKQIE